MLNLRLGIPDPMLIMVEGVLAWFMVIRLMEVTPQGQFSPLRLLLNQLLHICLHNLISIYILLVAFATIRVGRNSRADYDGSSRRSEGHPRGFYEPSTTTSSIGYRKGIGCKTYSSF